MPTVEHLVTDPEEMAERLPDAMKSVSEALEEGDFEAADELLEEALGSVLKGPGHGRRSMSLGFVPMVLWVWCGILGLLVLLSLVWR